MRALFGTEVPAPIDVMITRWSKDPHGLGTYSYTGAGVTPEDFEQLARPISKQLLLAGEHTLFVYYGTIHGAYLSGRAAAEAIRDRSGLAAGQDITHDHDHQR